MSDEQQLGIEDTNQIVVSVEDVAECEKFFRFFEISVAPELKAAFDAFKADPNFANQSELKFRLAEIISNSEHAVFKDEVFQQVRPETREVFEGLSFERDLEKELTSSE
jgi:hypothetical protein